VLPVLAASPISAQPPRTAILRVYVKTADTGEKSDLASRRESVTDVTEALAAKKKTFTIVDNETDADMVVEVLDRRVYVPRVVMGLSPRPGDPSSIPGMMAPIRSPILRVRVTRSEMATVFTNKNKPPESAHGWRVAADDLAGQIEKWTKKTG